MSIRTVSGGGDVLMSAGTGVVGGSVSISGGCSAASLGGDVFISAGTGGSVSISGGVDNTNEAIYFLTAERKVVHPLAQHLMKETQGVY